MIPRLDHREPVPAALHGAILALGNFDGFHLGHQAVAGEAIAWARAEGRPTIVATFDPHPVRHFVPDAPPFRLTTLDQRQELFAAAGADAMLVFHFDGELAGTSAADFVRVLLGENLGAGGAWLEHPNGVVLRLADDAEGVDQFLRRLAEHVVAPDVGHHAARAGVLALVVDDVAVAHGVLGCRRR